MSLELGSDQDPSVPITDMEATLPSWNFRSRHYLSRGGKDVGHELFMNLLTYLLACFCLK